MTFKPGYKRRKRTYSFRAWVDEDGWNVDRLHTASAGWHPCNHLKMWDVNRKGTGHNIIRITRGRGHFVVLLGKKYRKAINIKRKNMYR
jgi:hypothetical protein